MSYPRWNAELRVANVGTRLAIQVCVRLFLLATLGLLGSAVSAPDAQACPGRTACLARTAVVTPADIETAHVASMQVAAPSETVSRGPVRVLTLTLKTTFEGDPSPSRLHLSFDPMPEAQPIKRDMASVFAQASAKVDQTMPSVRRPTYNVMASPVIVAGTFDTVPGVGVSGAF